MITEGIYIASSDKLNLLVKIVGQGQFLRPIKGVLLNDFVCKGKVTELDESSKELQDFMYNSNEYDLVKAPLSKSSLNEIGLGTTSFAKVTNLDEIVTNYIDTYKNYMCLYGEEYNSKFIIELMTKENLTMNQANTIVTSIKRRINSL